MIYDKATVLQAYPDACVCCGDAPHSYVIMRPGCILSDEHSTHAAAWRDAAMQLRDTRDKRGRSRGMTGCELINCVDYKDGKCASTLDYVNRRTGEDMCPRHPYAIPRDDWDEYHDYGAMEDIH